MGLRVGAGAGSLSQPGSPSMTLAGLQQEANTPSGVKLKMGPAPSSAPAENPFDKAPSQGGNPFDQQQAGVPPQEEGLKSGGLSLNPPQDLGKAVLRKAGEHAKNIGMVAGGLAGGLAGGPVGGVAGTGAGAALGEKLQAFVKGQPQPTAGQSAMTATEYAALDVAGMGLGKAIVAGGKTLAGWAKPVTEALSPAVESAMQPLRDSALDLANYAKDKFPILKSQMLGMGDNPAATAAGKSVAKIAAGKGSGGTAAQQELLNIQTQQDTAMQHDLLHLHDTLPKPEDPSDFNPAGFVKDWIDRQGTKVGVYKARVQDQMQGYKADVSGMMDAVGAQLRKKGIIMADGSMPNLSSLSDDERYLRNFYGDMSKLAQRPVEGSSQFDDIWHQITSQAKGIQGVQPPVPLAKFASSDVAQGGKFVDMDTYEAMLRRVQSAAAEHGGDILPFASKHMTQGYYDMVGNELMKTGDIEGATSLKAASQEYSKYIDFAGSLGRQIEKNPDAAVRVMVNKGNPDSTALAMRLLTNDQKMTLSRAFVSNAVKDAADATTGQVSAKTVLQSLDQHGDKNLDLLFGDQKDTIMGGLQKMAHLQNTKLSFGAEQNQLNGLAKDMAKSDTLRNMKNMVIDWFSAKPDLKEAIGSPEFADKIYRMSQVTKIGGREVSDAAIQRGIGAAKTAGRFAPLAAGATLNSLSSPRTEDQGLGNP